MSLTTPAHSLAPASGASHARCPLCAADAAGSREVERISYAWIWEELGRAWGARFSPEVVARHTPAADASLRECGGCGLHYFVPVNPGDAEFYSQLSTSAAYYSEEKWEFGLVRENLAPGRRVLDVGCGDGNFLRAVRGAAAEAVGIDTNVQAVARACAQGLDARVATVEAFAAAHAEAFDVVCSFHVLEHLAEVMPFARAMRGCVRQGGTLVVSVPNRLRQRDDPSPEPLDCPPHHVSRWHPRQLEELAAGLGLELRAVHFETPEIHEGRAALRGRVTRALGRVGGAPGARAGYLLGRVLGRVVFPATLYPRLVRTGLLPRLGIYRHTMVAEMRRP